MRCEFEKKWRLCHRLITGGDQFLDTHSEAYGGLDSCQACTGFFKEDDKQQFFTVGEVKVKGPAGKPDSLGNRAHRKPFVSNLSKMLVCSAKNRLTAFLALLIGVCSLKILALRQGQNSRFIDVLRRVEVVYSSAPEGKSFL